MTPAETVTIVSVAIAALALAFNVLKDRRTEVLTSQSVRDKLDSIADIVRDTRDDVREVNHKLDDHATRLVRIEARLEEHDRRIAGIEAKEQ